MVQIGPSLDQYKIKLCSDGKRNLNYGWTKFGVMVEANYKTKEENNVMKDLNFGAMEDLNYRTTDEQNYREMEEH